MLTFMDSYAIEVRDVTKKFGDFVALDNVSLNAKKGKITGLLGPNGAGKTTLIKAMATLYKIDDGLITIDQVDVTKNPNKVRKLIGLAGQFAAVDDFLTGRETLEMVAKFYGMDKKQSKIRASEILKRLGLERAADKQAKTYSGGMRRRLDLGASLVATPSVLFLDEPTTGLDPRTRMDLWKLIGDLVRQGVTILLTTQYLEEADVLCDYIYVIEKGKMVTEGTSEQLKSSLGKDIIELKVAFNHLDTVSKLLTERAKLKHKVDHLVRKIFVETSSGSEDLLRIAMLLKDAKIKAEELGLHRPSLDDVFMEITDDGSNK